MIKTLINLKKPATGILPVLFFLLFAQFSYSQKKDTINPTQNFSGAVTLTNNGISIIPTFTLNKPAIMFNFSIGKGKLSFEPDFRFALEGKPWGFLFWWRYRLKANKFMLTAGAHPALNFRTEISPTDGSEKIVARRYLATEISPNYLLTKNISIGVYYLYSHGIDAGTIGNTNFITLNSNISNIRLADNIFMKISPQFYYLKLDAQDGFFFTSALTLSKKGFPLSAQAMINKRIKSNIAASKNFVWNASLIYSFSKKYIKLK